MATKKFDTSMSVWGQLANLPDLAKAYLFQVRFLYESESPLAQLLDSDDLMIKARTASLPQKDFKAVIENNLVSKIGIEFFDNAMASQPVYFLKKKHLFR